MTDAEILARGWRALKQLDRHADNPAPPFDQPEDLLWCGPCSRYGRALADGIPAATARGLRCPAAQQWHREVQDADEVAQRYEEASQ